jgi:hypothetical protein
MQHACKTLTEKPECEKEHLKDLNVDGKLLIWIL